MAKRTRLTRDQVEDAVTRVENGASHSEVARHYGVSVGCIRWHCLRQGAAPRAKLKPPPAEPITLKRNGFEVRRFTASEDQTLLELDAEGHGPAEIGRRLGRKSNSITGRLATLACHDEYREAAHGKAA